MKLRMSLWLCLCLVMSLFTPQGVADQTTVSYASEAAYVKTEGQISICGVNRRWQEVYW